MCIDAARRGILNRAEFQSSLRLESPSGLQAESERVADRRLLSHDRGAGPEPAVSGLLRRGAGARLLRPFYASLPPDTGWQSPPPVPAHWPELVRLLAAAESLALAAAPRPCALSQGAGAVRDRPAGGPLRRPALYALQSRHGPRPAPGRPLPRAIPTPPSSGWPLKTTTLPRSITSSFPPAANCASSIYAHAPEAARPVGGSFSTNHHAPRRPGLGAAWLLRRHGCAGRCLPARPHLRPGLCRVSTPRPLPRRACSSSTPPAATSTAWARPCSARPSSAPTSCMPRCSSATASLKPPAITPRSPSAPQSSLLFLHR